MADDSRSESAVANQVIGSAGGQQSRNRAKVVLIDCLHLGPFAAGRLDHEMQRIPPCPREERNPSPCHPCLFERTLPQLCSEGLQMVRAHVRDDTGIHIQGHQGCVAPPDAGLHRGPFDAMAIEQAKSQKDS